MFADKVTIKQQVFFFPLLIIFFSTLAPSCSSPGSKTQPIPEAMLTGDPLIDELSSRILEESDNAALYFKRAEALYQREAMDEAIADMEKALSLDSTNIDYLHFLADIYLDYFRSRKALETLYKAVKLNPKRIPTLLKLSEFQMIVEQYDQGLATTERIHQIDPFNAEAWFMQGLIQENRGDTASALDAYLKAGESDPMLIDAWIHLGRLLDEVRDPRAGLYFDNALRVDSLNAEALLGRGNAYFTQGMLEEAIATFEKIKRIDPQFPKAYFNSGLVYMELQDWDEAYNQFDVCVRVNPLYRLGYFYRGRASEQRGDLKTAKIDYQNALKMGGSFPAAEEALANVEIMIKRAQ
jgi:tetratricopeptide (TPR) repeat protein